MKTFTPSPAIRINTWFRRAGNFFNVLPVFCIGRMDDRLYVRFSLFLWSFDVDFVKRY